MVFLLGRGHDQGNPLAFSERVTQSFTQGNVSPWPARGIVAALFRAFNTVYERRVKAIRRIATAGSGILPAGELLPDLVAELADTAAWAAQALLRMCLGALDYAPPFDVTFGDYLQGLLTADAELVPDDPSGFRVAIVAALREWGIFHETLRSRSVSRLLLKPPEREVADLTREFVRSLNESSDRPWDPQGDRRSTYLSMQEASIHFHRYLAGKVGTFPFSLLGLALDGNAPQGIERSPQGLPTFEVRGFRPSLRVGPEGQRLHYYTVAVVQRRKGFFDEAVQDNVDSGRTPYSSVQEDFTFLGGCTFVIDIQSGAVRYCVRKSILSETRLANEREFRKTQLRTSLAASYLSASSRDSNPFALLHGLV
jgi:hypothetical protein